MRNLNPDQLLAFVTVVEREGFTNAAKALNLTQPAISLQIRELEARFGLPLLIREGRRPRLTGAGEALLDRARRILDEHETALAVMRRLKTNAAGEVRLGVTPGTLAYVAGGTIRTLKAAHPTLQLSVTVDGSPDLAQFVRDNALDLAILALPVDLTELAAEKLVVDPLVAILPDDGADLPDVATPQFMAEQPMVTEPRFANLRSMIAGWFAAERLEPQRIMQVDTLETIRSAVAAGLGAAIVPRMVVSDGPAHIRVLPIRPAMGRELVVVERSDRGERSQALDLVRSALFRGIGSP